MQPEYIIAIAAQVPLVAAFFYALNRGWFYTGREINRERKSTAEAVTREREAKDAEIAFLKALLAAAVAERKEAETRLDSFKDTLKEAADVLAQSVEFTERLIAEITRKGR